MNILLAGPYPTGTLEKFKALLPEHNVVAAKTQDVYDGNEDAEIIIVRVLKTPADTLQNKKKLKAVIRWGAGYDSVDIEAAGRQGVMVATTPGANAYAVAELAVALMLVLGRRIIENNTQTHNGVWDNKIYADQMTTLNHKTVGIIGGGNIGRSVARKVQTFGAKTVYYDAFRLKEETEQEYGLTFMPLEELLGESDVITLHVPLLDTTRHMIGAGEIAKMKDNVIIINTARGGLIDDTALLEALKSGKVAGAGLDCPEDENMVENPLAKAEHVIITPHMGGTSNDLPDEMIPRIVDQIRLFETQGTINFVVNRQFLPE